MSNDKTKWIFDDPSTPSSNDDGDFTENVSNDRRFDATHVGNNDVTVAIGGGADSGKTVFGFSEGVDEGVKPVTGWLVIVKGPGAGRAVALAGGMNAIGRADAAAVPLPFGDRMISSQDHIRIIYDDQERSFMIVPGTSGNVSRVNGQILANTMPLTENDQIQLSKATVVVFKPFCSAAFDWSDVLDGEGTDSE